MLQCDFVEPCSTCVLHGTTDQCEYDYVAVPRERRAGPRPSVSAPRVSDARALRLQLEAAEKTIAAQRARLQALEERPRPTTPHSQSDSSHLDAEEDATYVEIAGVGELLQRLVLDKAHSTAVPGTSGPKLSDNLNDLLLSSGTSNHFLYALAPDGAFVNGTATSPTALETLLPKQQTITTIPALIQLFPPRDTAFDLLDQYLAHVNLVHHLVDGPQFKAELASFYEGRSTPIFVTDPGWLSGMLAIFALAKASSMGKRQNVQPADFQSEDLMITLTWIDGALQALGMRMQSFDETIDLTVLRSICLVVWLFVLFGSDNKNRAAMALNSNALFRACEKMSLHRDPTILNPHMTARQAEDQRRIWWNLVNTDWLFTSITGRTYSAVSADGHDVNLPSPLVERGEDDPEARQAVQALAFRSILMGQLRRMSNWNLRRGVSESEVRKLEADIDRMETKLPECCRIDVDDYRSPPGDDPTSQAKFQQVVLTNVQHNATALRLHSHLCNAGALMPPWLQRDAPRHRMRAVAYCAQLLKLQRLQLTFARRVLGHSGYPRYHSSAAALVASGFLLNSTDPAERQHLYEHLSTHVAFLRSCGTLSEVTVHTMTAVEAALAKIDSQRRQQPQAFSPSANQGNYASYPAPAVQDGRYPGLPSLSVGASPSGTSTPQKSMDATAPTRQQTFQPDLRTAGTTQGHGTVVPLDAADPAESLESFLLGFSDNVPAESMFAPADGVWLDWLASASAPASTPGSDPSALGSNPGYTI